MFGSQNSQRSNEAQRIYHINKANVNKTATVSQKYYVTSSPLILHHIFLCLVVLTHPAVIDIGGPLRDTANKTMISTYVVYSLVLSFCF